MKSLKTVCGFVLAGIFVLMLVAWNPGSQSFNSSQFSAPQFNVNIKDGVSITNPVAYTSFVVNGTNPSTFFGGGVVVSNGVIIYGSVGQTNIATFDANGLTITNTTGKIIIDGTSIMFYGTNGQPGQFTIKNGSTNVTFFFDGTNLYTGGYGFTNSNMAWTQRDPWISPKQVFIYGVDSLSQTASNAWPVWLHNLYLTNLPQIVWWTNIAENNRTMQDAINKYTNEVQPLITSYVAAGTSVNLILWGGINDLATSAPPATVIGYLSNYCYQAKRDGARKMILMTITDSLNPTNHSLFTSNRFLVNQWIRTNNIADAIVDTSLTWPVVNSGWNIDNVHYNTNAMAQLAGDVWGVMNNTPKASLGPVYSAIAELTQGRFAPPTNFPSVASLNYSPVMTSIEGTTAYAQPLGAMFIGNTGNQAVPASTTVFYGPDGNGITNLFTSDTSTVTRALMSSKVTLSNLRVLVSGNPGATVNTVTVMTNGVASSITCTLNNVTTGSDTSHTETIIAGVEVGIKIVEAAGNPVKWSWSFEAYRAQ